ncbi:MAG: hypothetical protein ABIH21_00530 [Patescibacteria group bacterium]
MSKKNKIIIWAPRIIIIAIIAFMSLLSFDVFGEGYGFPEVLLALFMHLLPQIIMLVILVLAWKKPLIGGIVFICLGVFALYFFRAYEEIISFLIISAPLLISGVLFIVSKKGSGR